MVVVPWTSLWENSKQRFINYGDRRADSFDPESLTTEFITCARSVFAVVSG